MAVAAIVVAVAAVQGAATQAAPKETGPGVSVSGTLRERATLISDIEWNPDAMGNGWFWTQRLSVGADVRVAPRVRGRIKVLSALQEGGQTSPAERNNLDIQEAFAEFGSDDAFVRLGRQEVRLGSQRFVALREGTNVRRTWDGVRASADFGAWQVDVLALQRVEVVPDGVFNDDSPADDTLAGLYLTGPAPLGEADLYYLQAGFDERTTIEGTAGQDRHTVGTRFFGERGAWFWNWEAAYQWGHHGSLDISAWTLAANTGYRWHSARWSPEVELSTNIASGDDANGDGELGTFDALYPRGSYFSEAAILGPSNFFNVHPFFRVRPREGLAAFVDANFYWRLERADGVYGPPGNLIRGAAASDSRAISNAVSAGVEWTPREDVLLSVLTTYAVPQAFIEDTGPAVPLTFVEATLELNF